MPDLIHNGYVYCRQTRRMRPAHIENGRAVAILVDEEGNDYVAPPPAIPKTRIAVLGYIRGADEEADDGVWPGPIISQIKASPPGAEIHLHIDSQGGSFASTRAIIDALMARRERKIAHVEGSCCSGALLIAIACDERIADSQARFLAHAPHCDGCIARTHEETAWCATFIASRCPKIPLTRARAWLNRNNSDGDGVLMDSHMAFDLGIATSVWVDGKERKEIPQSRQPFDREDDPEFMLCQCPACKRARLAAAKPAKPVERKPEIPLDLDGDDIPDQPIDGIPPYKIFQNGNFMLLSNQRHNLRAAMKEVRLLRSQLSAGPTMRASLERFAVAEQTINEMLRRAK